jgi:hypothetical protein
MFQCVLKSDNMHVPLVGIHNYIYCTVDHCLEFEYPRDLDVLYKQKRFKPIRRQAALVWLAGGSTKTLSAILFGVPVPKSRIYTL